SRKYLYTHRRLRVPHPGAETALQRPNVHRVHGIIETKLPLFLDTLWQILARWPRRHRANRPVSFRQNVPGPNLNSRRMLLARCVRLSALERRLAGRQSDGSKPPGFHSFPRSTVEPIQTRVWNQAVRPASATYLPAATGSGSLRGWPARL